jgi:hypothetical protein
MVTVPEISADYHRSDTKRKNLDQRIRRLSPNDIVGRDSLLVEMDAVIANLHEVAGRLAAIPAHNMNDLRAKATVLITMRDREAEDMTALSLGIADDIMNLSANQCGASACVT